VVLNGRGDEIYGTKKHDGIDKCIFKSISFSAKDRKGIWMITWQRTF
jgi:hypothetical protein